MWWAKEFPRALNVENLNIICKQQWTLLPRGSLHFPLICKSRERPVFIHRGECSYAYLRWHFLLNLWKLPPLKSKVFRTSHLYAALEAAEPIFIMGSEAAASFYVFPLLVIADKTWLLNIFFLDIQWLEAVTKILWLNLPSNTRPMTSQSDAFHHGDSSEREMFFRKCYPGVLHL